MRSTIFERIVCALEKYDKVLLKDYVSDELRKWNGLVRYAKSAIGSEKEFKLGTDPETLKWFYAIVASSTTITNRLTEKINENTEYL